MIIYANPINAGTDQTSNLGNGSIVNIKWFKAYTNDPLSSIGYNLYYSTDKDKVFSDGVKYISIDDSLEANIIDLIPGQLYFFSSRPFEYKNTSNLSTILPIAYDNLRILPTSLLKYNITDSSPNITLLDSSEFPNSGVIKIGVELISYSSNSLNTLVVNQRGYSTTHARNHNVNGYDGHHNWDPTIVYHIGGESIQHDRIFENSPNFAYPNFAFTLTDGYKQITKDILSTDLSASDAFNTGFAAYDYAGWHRTDPVELLSGKCVGSYIGGEQGCIDKYGNVNMVRGFDLQTFNNQRQELGLSITGRVAVLLQRQKTGIVCSCYQNNSEYQDDRCPFCYGTKYVIGYNQYFNPRRSDGRIMVRVKPTDEALKMRDAGLESELQFTMWTTVLPSIYNRDVLILFDQDNNEEFRYEVISVTRNQTILGLEGQQSFITQRIRKTDPAYQVKSFRDTSQFPQTIETSLTNASGLGLHKHTFQKNEKDPSGWQQISGTSASHNHILQWNSTLGKLIVLPTLGHDHRIIL